MIREWTLDDFRAFFYLKVYRYLKTVIIMPIETRFKCEVDPKSYIVVDSDDEVVAIKFYKQGSYEIICLDIPTSIKLSKTIRTHINLVKSKQNGNR